MKSTFKVAFFLKRKAVRHNGTVPIITRITINGKVAQFATKFYIAPEQWSVPRSCALGQTAKARETNSLLEEIKARLYSAYHELMLKDAHVTSEKVKTEFLGISTHNETLISLFDRHNEDVKKLVGISKSKATYQKYTVTRKHVANFIKSKYKLSDISLKEINLMFLEDFAVYLQTECNCNSNTTAKFMQFLKRIVLIARNNGIISSDPFSNYKIRIKKVDRGYLTEDELKRMLQRKFLIKRLEIVRDIFIFSCFTGLSYIDVKNLTTDSIKTGFDGKQWIMTKRQKTNVQSNILLLDIPLKIIEKYKGQPNRYLLPVLSNQKMNAYLKEIGDLCAINKEITYHLARHTFATTVTLAKGVPIESVSKMLGHSNIRTTQIYARITNEKISRDMNCLEEKLEDMNGMIRL
ncbi:MAG: site-specific integrase [Bacteroidales bacterium]